MAGAGEVVIVAATLIALVVTYLVQNRKLLLSRSPTTNVSLKIESLYFYPVKGLRGCSIQAGKIGPLGFQDDRSFCLQKVHRDPGTQDIKLYESLHAGLTLELALFSTFVEEEVEEDDDDDGQGHGKHLVITWTGPENADVQAGTEQIPWMGSQEEKKKTTTAQPHQAAKFQLRLPFRPGVQGLKTLHVDMHGATTTAFDMGDEVAAWFTRHLGFETRMAYLGPAHSRPVLGSGAPSSDLAVQKRMPRVLYRLRQLLVPPAWRAAAERISFTDIAQFLVVTTESNAEVTRRLREDEDTTAAAATGDGDNDNKNVQMDVTKFRPNIVLSGSPVAFDEDYWAELLFRRTGVRMAVTLNCWRCQSIVVDYRTGRPAAGASGLAWKKLSRDRRVDKGWKYNPVFGRYGFCAAKETDKEIRVGDEVLVAKRAPEISVFDWPMSSASSSAYKS